MNPGQWSRLALPLLAALVIKSSSDFGPPLTDPYRIAPVVGVALGDSADFECTRTESRTPDGILRPSHTCVSRIPERTRRAPTTTWLLSIDSTGRVYSGQRDWGDERVATARRRDSVATALGARGARHVVCPDSVDRQRPATPRWLSMWRGRTYNAILYHYWNDESWVLSLQVSPGAFGRCASVHSAGCAVSLTSRCNSQSH